MVIRFDIQWDFSDNKANTQIPNYRCHICLLDQAEPPLEASHNAYTTLAAPNLSY